MSGRSVVPQEKDIKKREPNCQNKKEVKAKPKLHERTIGRRQDSVGRDGKGRNKKEEHEKGAGRRGGERLIWAGRPVGQHDTKERTAAHFDSKIWEIVKTAWGAEKHVGTGSWKRDLIQKDKINQTFKGTRGINTRR